LKQYSSEKRQTEDEGWRHTRVVLSPLNPSYRQIVIENPTDEDFSIIAEFVGVMRA